MFPNNISPDMLKQSTEMFKNMSDDDLRRNMDSARGFMPGNLFYF